MITEKQKNLCSYRLSQSEETLKGARLCFENHLFKDAINRSYYAAFYAIKAVLALENVDFKRHKDVVSYFNQFFVANEKFPKEIGRKLSRLQKKREASDYDDFYVASMDESIEQLAAAELISDAVHRYIAALK